MPRRSCEPSDPVHGPAQVRTIKHEAFELPLEVGLHLEELLGQHFGLECDRMRAVEASDESLIDDRVRLRRLLAHRSDGPLEDLFVPVGMVPSGTMCRWQRQA
jgi:hypothetical protein